MSRNSKLYLSTAIGISVATMFLLPAQSLKAAEKTAVSSDTALVEIVVTARKRKESLQNVPISVSTFSQKDLAALSVSNLQEAAQFAPNVVFNNTGPAGSTAPAIFIRGIGQAASNEVFF
ncbi:MAG: TonB-dependent receptor plug domain-containing protein, partial [Alphaproteobacteria bacterium]|nr:TonB-dependent receptor plug domain-containing protein [Alphaproteobacteria bacterium]